MADFTGPIRTLKLKADIYRNETDEVYQNTVRTYDRAAAVLEAVGKASAAGALDTAVLALAVYPHSAAYDYIRALRDAVEGK